MVLSKLGSSQRLIQLEWQGAEIGVALGTAAIIGGVWCIDDRGVAAEPLDQVGVPDERAAERDHIGMSGRDGFDRKGTVIAVVRDVGGAESPMEGLEV